MLMIRTFAFALCLALLLLVGGGSARAQTPACSDNFLAIQNLINQDIVSGVAGGIKATTVNSLMTIQNSCYLNVESYNSSALAGLAIAPNTTGGFATWPVAGGGGGGGVQTLWTSEGDNWISGTATALTMTTNQSGFALNAGNMVCGIATFTNGANATLNVNGTGAIAITKASGTRISLAGSEILAWQTPCFMFDGSYFDLMNAPFGASGGGNVSNVGTPLNGQIAQWTSSGTLQGIATVPISAGGTGTASPGLVQGTGITVTGSWPNQTIASAGSGSSAPGVNAVTTCGVVTGGSVDQSTKINSCLTTYQAVALPCGTYYITAPIIVPSNSTLVGGGPYCTTISITSTTATAVLATPTPFNVNIGGFSVIRTGTPTSGATGVRVDDCNADVKLHDMWVIGHWEGVSLGATSGGFFENTMSTENYNNGVDLTTSSSCNTQPMQWQLTNVFSTLNDGWGFLTIPGTGGGPAILIQWIGTTSYANTAGGYGFIGTSSNPIHGVSLYNCVASTDGGPNGGSIVINSGSGHAVKNCYVELTGTGTTGHAFATAASGNGSGIALVGSNGVGWVSLNGNDIINTSNWGINISATTYTLMAMDNKILGVGNASNSSYDGVYLGSPVTIANISNNIMNQNIGAASNGNVFRAGIYNNTTTTNLTANNNTVVGAASFGFATTGAITNMVSVGNNYQGAYGGCNISTAPTNYVHTGMNIGSGC